ncbi:MAG: peptidylprolyl isomerase [Coriobacteriia bacterium]|nr:peptidylprolyl isomerase [Coriobacteriia bacterium]
MRTFRGIAAIFFAVALVLGAAGCDSDKGVVARVNGEDITQVQFDRYYEQVITQMGGELDEETALQYKQQLLSLLIESELVTQEAEELGADLSPEAVDAGISELMGGETDMTVIEQQVVAAGLTMDDLRDSVRDQLARDYLAVIAAEETSVTTMPETYSLLSHILVSDEALATDLRAQIVAGGDFAALASANSSDTASAMDGGSLGWAPFSDYVPQFAEAAETLEVGAVSEPVRSDYGWHIILKVDEYAEGEPIADAPDSLRTLMTDSSTNLALQEYINKLREEADIEYVDETLKPVE